MLKSSSGEIIYIICVLFPMVILNPQCIPHHWRFLKSWRIPVVTIGVKALWDVSFRPGEPGWGDKAWLRTNHGHIYCFLSLGSMNCFGNDGLVWVWQSNLGQIHSFWKGNSHPFCQAFVTWESNLVARGSKNHKTSRWRMTKKPVACVNWKDFSCQMAVCQNQ